MEEGLDHIELMAPPQKVLSPSRHCDGCTVCCRVLQVNDTPGAAKPAGVNCQWLHKEPYSGCSIYKDRPPSCISFECLYIKLARRPDIATSTDLRPDKSGVMFVHQPDRRYFTAHVHDPQRPDAWQDPEPYGVIQKLCQEGFCVIITWGPTPRKLLLQRDEAGGIRQKEVIMGKPDPTNGEQQALEEADGNSST